MQPYSVCFFDNTTHYTSPPKSLDPVFKKFLLQKFEKDSSITGLVEKLKSFDSKFSTNIFTNLNETNYKTFFPSSGRTKIVNTIFNYLFLVFPDSISITPENRPGSDNRELSAKEFMKYLCYIIDDFKKVQKHLKNHLIFTLFFTLLLE